MPKPAALIGPTLLASPPSGGTRWDRLGNLSVTANQWQGEARVPCERFMEDPEPRPYQFGPLCGLRWFRQNFQDICCLLIRARLRIEPDQLAIFKQIGLPARIRILKQRHTERSDHLLIRIR